MARKDRCRYLEGQPMGQQGQSSYCQNRSVGLAQKTAPKNAWNKLWPDLEVEKDFNKDHRKEYTDFVQSIPGFQEYNKENVETWMECDAEDC
ncbi:hypothetical protein TNCV_3444731 [Trichonephila clavipes]|nr:hypothetical protein TNCV_3444731 [Trichonephila clavipes]